MSNATTACIDALSILPGEEVTEPVSFVGILRPGETLASAPEATLYELNANGTDGDEVDDILGSPAIIGTSYENRYGATIPANMAVSVPIDATNLPQGTYKLYVYATTSLGNKRGVWGEVVCTSTQ